MGMVARGKLPRICLIYTGGTIGMVREDRDGETVLVPPKSAGQFLKHVKVENEVNEIAELDFVELMNKDSTNMIPADWTDIAKAIHSRLHLGYRGFVVAHGTDTMHFSSSAVAFAFGGNLNVPIVFTGAQTTPDIPYGDARVNLLRAIKTAGEDLAEVVVVFGDFVFRGCCVQKKDERKFDAFESPAIFPLGYVTEAILLSGDVKRRSRSKSVIDFQPDFADGIIQISLIPGLRPKVLFPLLDSDECRGIVLQSFGSGNVPNDGEDYSFREFIRRATGRGIPVIIASQFPANSTLASHYLPGVEAINAGAIPTGNMTNAAATVKFRWLLHIIQKEIENGKLPPELKLSEMHRRMNYPYVRELTAART